MEGLGSSLLPRMGREWVTSIFEYRSDYRDLALDGRHWRAQFGGSSGPGPKMGGYVCCGPILYVMFRLTMLATALSFLAIEFVRALPFLTDDRLPTPHGL